jgi:PTS hybrid protein
VTSLPTRNGFVALVLVSHSAAIADGLAELVGQVAGPDVPIVAAGGGPDGSFGTDGGRVLEALRSAAAGAGGIVLMDIGSAVLSVRAAIEELGAAAESLIVVDAPLVEGAIAAGVTASTGGSRDEVAAAAREARGAHKF